MNDNVHAFCFQFSESTYRQGMKELITVREQNANSLKLDSKIMVHLTNIGKGKEEGKYNEV